MAKVLHTYLTYLAHLNTQPPAVSHPMIETIYRNLNPRDASFSTANQRAKCNKRATRAFGGRNIKDGRGAGGLGVHLQDGISGRQCYRVVVIQDEDSTARQ